MRLNLPWHFLALGLCLVLPQTANAKSVVIDGVIDESEWTDATVIDDFVVVEPFSRGRPAQPTIVRMLSTPEGLAFAFRCVQPPGVRRLSELTPRDANMPGDRVNIFIDFNADGETAYNFTIGLSGAVQDATITNENAFSTDWDGDWQHAVSADDAGWSAEFLLPWSVAAMRDSAAPRRTVALMVDRVIGSPFERSGAPAATFTRPRYVSEFRKFEIDQYASSVLHFFPYASAGYDFIGDSRDAKTGMDLYWKPSGDFQLTAALNPDFGQVEADELVVNFDAVESFFSDRRPFFTENQALFDLRTPDNGLLIYTRRIGGPADDGSGQAADIDLALKLNGSAFGFGYGVLSARESDHADDLGSLFYAQRLLKTGTGYSLGYLSTYTDRPFLERQSQVHAFDGTWRANERWSITGQVLTSAIDGAPSNKYGSGVWARIDYTPTQDLRQEWELTHFDRGLDFNDMGFQRRASLNELEWTVQYQENLDAQESPLRGRNWFAEIQTRSNDSGDLLPVDLILDLTWQFRSGAKFLIDALFESAGYNDLISRGNGLVRFAPRHSIFFEYETPRLGRWQLDVFGRSFQESLGEPGAEIGVGAAFYASEKLTLDADVAMQASRGWVIWDQDTRFGEYERELIDASLNLNWFPLARHEVRVKLQWLGISAHDALAYRIGPAQYLIESGETLEDFSISNLGLQLRYRWEFAPQSDLYVVYGRGGFVQEDGVDRDLAELLDTAIELRDADQFLIKVRKRF